MQDIDKYEKFFQALEQIFDADLEQYFADLHDFESYLADHAYKDVSMWNKLQTNGKNGLRAAFEIAQQHVPSPPEPEAPQPSELQKRKVGRPRLAPETIVVRKVTKYITRTVWKRVRGRRVPVRHVVRVTTYREV